MRIWGIVSQKGGSGKTMLALHLSIAAVSDGMAVSIIDLDPQRSAEQWSELRGDKTRNEEPAIVHGTAQGLDGMLAAARKTRSDLVVIDTPPAIERSMIYAAAASDIVVVPTRCSVLDCFALKDTLDYLVKVGAQHKTAVVINAPGKDAAGRAAVGVIARECGVRLISAVLEEHADLSKSLGQGLGITEGKSKKSKGVVAIKQIYGELCSFENEQISKVAS